MQRLTDAMRRDWIEQGYILLKNALNRDEVENYLAAANEVTAQYREAHPEVHQEAVLGITQTVERSPAFDSLLDHPSTFGVITDLLGPYLQVMGTVIYVRYPGDEMLLKWHTDAGPALRDFRVEPGSRPLSFKVQHFLTDIPAHNRANFCLVPGSHCQDFPEDGLTPGQWPEGGIQLIVEAGDVAIFPHNLWHAIAAHEGHEIRRGITFRYGQIWSRPWDYEKAPEELLQRLTPRQRRLMGDIGPQYGPADYFSPKDQLEIILDGIE